jgi:hypothetical protein
MQCTTVVPVVQVIHRLQMEAVMRLLVTITADSVTCPLLHR